MELTTEQDIDAPIDRIFAELSDFDAMERRAIRHGATVHRESEGGPDGCGMRWHARAQFRGKPHDLDVSVVAIETPELLQLETRTGGLEARCVIELVALSDARTRVTVSVALKAKTLSARLLVQSIKLAKGEIDRKFRKRMAGYAEQIEARVHGTW